ncbi:TPA: hypothetical protein MIM71_09615 [Klebsiella variicola]|nr:hypothetical protein [Klebsiella variicola]
MTYSGVELLHYWRKSVAMAQFQRSNNRLKFSREYCSLNMNEWHKQDRINMGSYGHRFLYSATMDV